MPRRSPSKSPAVGQTSAAKRATRGSVGGSRSPRAKPPAKATPPVKATPPAKATPPLKATAAKATPPARGRSTGRPSSKAASPSKKRVESASPARRGVGAGDDASPPKKGAAARGGASPPKKGAAAKGGAGQQKKKQAATAKSPTAKRGASAPRGGKRGGKEKQESEEEEEEEEESPAASPKKSKGGRSPRRTSSPAKPPTPSSGRGKGKQKTPTPSKTKKPKSPSASGTRKRKGRADSQSEAGSGKKKVKLSESAASDEEKDEKSGEGEERMEVEQKVEESNASAEGKEAEPVAMATDSSQLANKEVEPGVKEAVHVVKEAEKQDGVDSLATESGFVVIGPSDVPPANSAEVLAAIPPVVVVAPPTDESPTSTSGKNPAAGGSPARSKSPALSEISKSVTTGNSPTSGGSPTGRGGAEANSSSQTSALINGGAAVDANGHSSDVNGAVQQTAEGPGAQAQTKCGGDKPPTTEPPPSDELFSRRWIANPSCHPSTTAVDRSITLVSYNVLADCHAGRDYASAPWLPAGDHWTSDSRHDRLIAELTHLDADIVCLQEVGTDYFVRRLQPALGALGYEGVHYPRTIYPEGEATFCRLSRLSLLSHRGVTLKTAIQAEVDVSPLEADVKVAVKDAVDTFAVALLTRFKVVGVATADQSELSIANIHCSWERQDRSDRLCLQVASTMRALVEVAGGPTHPHIVCGDFNSTPSSAPYQLMHDGHLSDKSLSALQAIGGVAQPDGQMAPLVNYWSEGFQYSPSSNMKSAYLTVTGEEPVTARMPHNASVQAVDYIWFSANALECAGVLATVARDRWEGGVPNQTFPSDHLSLKAKLVFK